MHREVKIGTVSWINETPHPVKLAAQAKLLNPEWVVKTYIGLVATSNPAPGDREDDFNSLVKSRNFRAMTFCHFTFDEEAAKKAAAANRGRAMAGGQGFERVALAPPDLIPIHMFFDPGWTPPFAISKFPSTILSFDSDIYSDKWYRGERSPLANIVVGRRHRNSTIKNVPFDDVVLVNALVKIRAGKHTDDLGINTAGAPYHVPWVWCEVLVTYSNGQIKLYGRGSVFPSHAWYLDGKRVARTVQLGDTSFPKKLVVPRYVPRVPGVSGIMNTTNPTLIDIDALQLYPVLTAGPPASGPQVPWDADEKLTTELEKHPYTVQGTAMVTN